MLAVINGNLQLVELLLSQGASSCHLDRKGFTALTYAVLAHSAYSNRSEIVRVLSNNSDVNQQDKNGLTPVMVALLLGKVGIAKVLVDGGADLKAHNLNYGNILIMCVATSQLESVKFILEHITDIKDYIKHPVFFYNCKSQSCKSQNGEDVGFF